ncbi:MAG: T9SS type A sorting domain-containing protein [Candidatus Kapabacteria bacterium]|nr:T9SS type A sorting domain-containing protein [Candidatus Kapabacteria bacterium]
MISYILNIIWLVLILNSILYSQTEWEQVHPSTYGTAAKFNTVRCLDSLNCVCLVWNGTVCCEGVLKSTDGGKTWSELYYEKITYDEEGNLIWPQPRYMNSVSYKTVENILISRSHGMIFRSKNGGESFDTVRVVVPVDGKYPSSSELKNIHMFSNSKGAVVSTPNIYITNDYWDSFEMIEISHPDVPDDYIIKALDIHFFDKDKFTIYFFANKEISPNNFHFLFKGFLTTTDNGKTWHMQDILNDFQARNVYINSLFSLNPMIGWAVGYVVYDTDNGGRLRHGLVYKTYNGGYTWDLIHVDETEPKFGLWDIAFYDELNGITVGKYGKILRTTDGGYKWFSDVQLSAEQESSRLTQEITFAGQNPIVCAWQDGIVRGTYTPSSVKESAEAGSGLSVFPNPASEYIEITIAINPTVNRGVDEIADIKIFNTLGECVEEIPLNPPLPKRETRIDVSHLPRGVYYVRIGSRTQMFVKM